MERMNVNRSDFMYYGTLNTREILNQLFNDSRDETHATFIRSLIMYLYER